MLVCEKLQRIVSLDTKQVTIQKLLWEINYLETDKPEAFWELWFLWTDLSAWFEKLIEGLTTKIRKLEQWLVAQEAINIFEKLNKYEWSIESRLYKSIETFYSIRSKR